MVTRDLAWSDGESVARGAIVGNVVEVATNDAHTAAYADLAIDEARQRRQADAVVACAAQELKADLYITGRPYL